MLLLKNYFKLNILIVTITVVSSFFLEYILELSPCRICLYQRYLWLLLLSTLIYFLFFLKKFKTLSIFIISFILLILVILSIYHSGIEFGLFSNIITCTSNSGLDANSIEQLDKIIRQTENTSCSFPKFRLIGLSLANMSLLLSFILLIFNLIILKKKLVYYHAKKNRRNNQS